MLTKIFRKLLTRSIKMKIYNFLFDPDLNNLRLNMDASLVDPLEKGKNIELFDLSLIHI